MTQEQFFSRYTYDVDTDLLGSGGFGKVYKAFDEIRNRYVAIKVSEVVKERENLSLMKEVELASSLPEHKNVAHYEGCHRFKTPHGTFDYGILQYYPMGNLSQLVKSKKLSDTGKVKVANGIIHGIHHLHSNSIIHRDLKSANILIAEGSQGEFVPKIADFGLSKQFAENDKSYFSNSIAGGSLLYVAPEQLEGKELRKNVDLWSLGVVLYELFEGETPFRASVDDGSEKARAEIIKLIENADIPNRINSIPSPWKGIIESCLIADPEKRIKSIEEIKRTLDLGNGVTIVDSPPKPTPPGPTPPGPKIPKWVYYFVASVILLSALFLIIRSNLSEEEVFVMNEDLLKAIYEKEGFSNKGISYEKFKKDIQNIKLQEEIYNTAKFAKKGITLSEFRRDLGLSETKIAQLELDAKHKISEEINSTMVPIPGGTFMMGCIPEERNRYNCPPSTEPSHFQTVRSFKLNKYEVTQEQWEVIMGTNIKNQRDKEQNKNSGNTGYQNTSNQNFFPWEIKGQGKRFPIYNISWDEAQEFIKKLNHFTNRQYRLPTESEWEFASKSDQNYIHSGSDNIGNVSWYSGNSENSTKEVGTKDPNNYGLFDLNGNVSEWCVDIAKDNPGLDESWKEFPYTWRVIRGGDFVSRYCYVYTRSAADQEARRNNIGFRLAAD